MNKKINSNLTNIEISRRIKQELDNRKWTLERCCYEYNLLFSKEIDAKKVTSLNKDFLSRVSREGGFKVLSERIAKICEFLTIDIENESRAKLLSEEIKSFQEEVLTNKKMERNYKTLTEFLTEISSVRL